MRETLARVGCDALAAAVNPRFLAAFMDRTGRSHDTVDLLLAAAPAPGRPAVGLAEIGDPCHPRVVRARRHRDDVRVWTAGGGCSSSGAGSRDGWRPPSRSTRAYGTAGWAGRSRRRRDSSCGEPVWVQVAPGNARGLRAFQAAGYRPVGAEALLTAP